MLTPFITGFVTLITLILAVGAQNVFILRQGLLRNHIFVICIFAAISDALLIWIGVIGFSTISIIIPGISKIMALAGSTFLSGYGIMRFINAYQGSYGMEIGNESSSLNKSWVALAGFTFLNPHVYSDTVFFLGNFSKSLSQVDRYYFGAGAAISSFLFFFILGYLSKYFSKYLKSAKVWKRINYLIIFFMSILALTVLMEII